MANEHVFVESFMRGFSFVDEIKRQKKADQRLEARLAEDKAERSFQRRRQIASDRRVGTLFEQQQEDRADRLEDEQKREEGDRIALNPDATDDQLREFAPYSPEAAAALKRRNEEARIKGAIQGAGTIGTASPSAAQPRGLSDAVAAQGAGGGAVDNPVVDPQQAQTAEAVAASQGAPEGAAGFQFAPSAGRGGLETVSEEEFNKFNREFQDKGFFGKIGDVVAGQGSQTVRAAEDAIGGIFNAPGRIRGAITGEDINPAPQNTGQEFTGELNLPGEFTTAAEFEEMQAAGATPEEIQAASARNFAITEQYVKQGRRPRAMAMDAYSRQGAALQASDETRRAAIAAEEQAITTAQDFIDPARQADSQLGQMAVQDPKAATVRYLETRATLQDANPQLANQMDAAMLPVLDAAEAELTAQIAQQDPNTPKGRQALNSLAHLQDSRDTIAKNQPSVSRSAGINSSGLKVGDHPRVQAVADEIFNPERPAPTQNTAAQVNAATTVANRITPNKRLNERQIDSLAVLAQAGYIDKPTALSVMMTGQWPPGKNPNGVTKIQEAGGNVYAITEGGNVMVLQRGKGNPGSVPNREIGEDQFNWVRDGIRSKFPNMEDANVNGLTSILNENPGWVRSRFNVTSQEDMRKLGAMIAESKTMASMKFADLQDGFLWFDGNTKEAPTVNEILMDPDMRDKIANEFDLTYIPLPEMKDIDGIDEEAVRQAARDGRMGPTAAENADNYTEEQLLHVYGTWRYTELDAAGRLEVDRDGNVTILPPQQEQ